MKIRPVGNRILVKPLTAELKTKSGIVLPETTEKERKAQGEVVELGTGQMVEKSGIKIGDVVFFGKYSGEDVEMVGEDGKKTEYKILSLEQEKDQSEVLAILDPK